MSRDLTVDETIEKLEEIANKFVDNGECWIQLGTKYSAAILHSIRIIKQSEKEKEDYHELFNICFGQYASIEDFEKAKKDLKNYIQDLLIEHVRGQK